jgi:isomerase DpgB
MVTGGQINGPAGPAQAPGARAAATGLELKIDGRDPLSAAAVAAIEAVCDRSDERDHANTVIVHVSGVPQDPLAGGLTVGLVTKWERALRRLERLAAVTIGVAGSDCGGIALDALLATDCRIASATIRLVLPIAAGATWPGMALYRLARQAGESAIRRAVLFGTPIEAPDALAMHLIDEVTDDPSGALAAATALAASYPGAELAIRRQLVLEASAVSFEDALGAHLAACDRALRQASAEAM